MRTTTRRKPKPATDRRATAPAGRTITSDSQLLQDYLQSTGILVSSAVVGAGKVAAFQNAEGQTEAIVIDPLGSVYHACREPLSDSGWNMYGIGAGFQAIAAVDAATFWAVGNDGGLWRSDHGRWTETQAMPSGQPTLAASVGSDGTVWAIDGNQALFARGPGATATAPQIDGAVAPVLIGDASARLHFFCVDTGGAVWTTMQGAPCAGWGAWTLLGTPASGIGLTRLAVAANQDGRLQVFAIGSDANLYTVWQQAVAGPWSAWATLAASGPQVGAVAVGQNADGRLEVFAVVNPDSDTGFGTVSHIWQTAPNDGWSGWADMPLPAYNQASELTVIRDIEGCLQLVAVGDPILTSGLWTQQTAPGQGWTAWQQLGSPTPTSLGSPVMMRNEDGHLEVFALDTSRALWHIWQVNGVWTGAWASLGGICESLAVGQNHDGRLEIFVAGENGALWHIWQTSPNNGWSTWASLGGPPADTMVGIAVVQNQIGAIEIIAAGASHASWRIAQSDVPPTTWTNWMGQWWCWYPVPGAPQLKGAPVGQNGDAWAIGASGSLLQWQGTAWTSTTLPGGLAPAVLALDGEGALWVLAGDSSGSFFRFVGGQFQQLPTGLPGAISLGASSASTVRATATVGPPPPVGQPAQYALYAYENGAWAPVISPPLGDVNWNNFPQTSVGGDGTVWLLDGTGNAFKQTMAPPTWARSARPAATPLSHLAAARGGRVWGVDGAGVIWQFNGSWTAFRHALPAGTVAQVAPGGPGTLWAIDTDGNPYGYDAATASWQRAVGVSGPLLQAPTGWAIAPQALYQYVVQDQGGSAFATWNCTTAWSEFTASRLSVGTDGSPFALDTEGRLWNLAGFPAVVAGTPAGLVQIAVVDASRIWGLAQSAGLHALHLYAEGRWQEVETPASLFSNGAISPVLSSAGDGTVWLLDAGGIPWRLAWSPREISWCVKGGATTFQSIAAANTSSSTPATARIQEAWAVDAEGDFRRSFGDSWIEPHAPLPGGALPTGVSVGADGSIWALDGQGGLYRKQTWSQPPVLATAPLAAQGEGGALFLFCLDQSGHPWVAASNPEESTWSTWTALPAPGQLTRLVAGAGQNGALNLVALAASGLAYVASRSGTGWGAWTALGSSGEPPGVPLVDLTAGRDGSNLLHVFALGIEGSVWVAQQATTGWTEWTAMPSPAPAALVALVAGTDQDGILEVFAWDTSGVARHSWQDAQAPSGWSDWWVLGATGQPPGPIALGNLATGNQPNGTLFVLGTGSDGAVYATNQAPTASGWSDWVSLGPIAGVQPLALATAGGASGAAVAFAQGSDGAIYTATQEPGSATGWSPWASTGAAGPTGVPLGQPCAGASADGTPRAFAVGGGSLWQTRPQAGSASGWRDWGRLSGPQPWQPMGAQNFARVPAGEASALWAAFRDGSVQTSADGGSTWTAVAFPSAGAPAAALDVSVGLDGAVWAVTATACYQLASGAWQLAGAGRFARAPVGTVADLWAVDPDGAIQRSADGGATWWEDASYPGIASQLSMCADGSVWALDQDGTASLAAAWQRIMRPTGMPGYAQLASAAEVVAGQDEHGTRYAFLVAPENGRLFYSYELFHHAWSQPTGVTTSTAEISNIGLTYQQDTGELIVYAAPTQGTIHFAQKSPGHRYEFALWSAPAKFQFIVTLPLTSGALELSAVDAEHWYWFTLFGSNCIWAQMTGSNPGEIFFAGIETTGSGGTPRLAQLLRLPWPRPSGAPFCAALDESGQIYTISDFRLPPSHGLEGSGLYQPLTGANTPIANGVILAAGLLQADAWSPPGPRIYALAANTAAGSAPALWMSCQTNVFASSADPAAWSTWVPLGGAYAALYNGPAFEPTDTLFAIDSTTSAGSLDAIRQDPLTGVWREGVVKRPSQSGDDIEVVPMYQTDATIYDAKGIPEAGVAVTILAETPVDAWIENALYPLDSRHGITVSTSALGRLSIRTQAASLHAPRLTFVAAGLGADAVPAAPASATGGAAAPAPGVTIAPSQHVYDFLHGTGSLPVGGGAPATLTASTLASATVNGQRLNPSMTSQTAQPIVSNIIAIAKIPSGSSGSSGSFALAALRHMAPPGSLPGSWFSHAWDDFKHAVGSIAHAIEKGIVDAAVSVAGDVVTLAVYIGNTVVATFELVVKTVEQAVRAIEMIVATLIADIKEFIQWLMLLFDWENILATQRAFKGFIEQAVGILESRIGTAQQQVASVFASLQGELQADFQAITASGNIGGYANFGDLPNHFSGSGGAAAPPRGAAGSPGPGGGSPPISGSSSVHHNWFVNKVLAHVTPSFSIPAIPGFDPSSFLDALDLGNTVSAISQAGQDFLNFLQTIFTDPQQFASTGIVDLLQAVESLLLALVDLIEDLVEAFLAMVQTILAGTLDVLSHSVDIPIIGTLFKFLTGEDMTLLNLGTLMAAVPLYILYEIAFGGMPFAGLGRAAGVADPAPGPGMSAAHQWANVFMVFGLINWFVAGLSDLITIAETPFVNPDDIPDLAPILTLASLMLVFGLQIASWPDDQGFPFVTDQSPSAAQIAVWFNYAIYWGPPLVALAAARFPAMGGDAQNVVNTILGAAGLISGIVAAIRGLATSPPIVTPAGAVELIIGPISLSLDWLLVTEVRQAIWESSEDTVDPAWLIFIVDLINNLAVPILDEISANS